MSDPQPIGSLTGTPIPPLNASYTALTATLIILLGVASAIVVRSLILRQRRQRLLDHPHQGGIAAGDGRMWTFGNDIGPQVQRGFIGEKPGVWQTWIQSPGVVGGASGRLAWADIKPLSVAYVDSGEGESSPQHVVGPPLPPSAACGTWRILSPCRRRPRSMESSTSPPTIKPPPPSRSQPSKLRVAVLVAMPTPEYSFFSSLRRDSDEGSDGPRCKVGGLPPIEMGAVEMVVRDD